ncbi:MAG: hypothetical protein WCL04_04180 [Verrucomicrobiota bacterium]
MKTYSFIPTFGRTMALVLVSALTLVAIPVRAVEISAVSASINLSSTVTILGNGRVTANQNVFTEDNPFFGTYDSGGTLIAPGVFDFSGTNFNALSGINFVGVQVALYGLDTLSAPPTGWANQLQLVLSGTNGLASIKWTLI